MCGNDIVWTWGGGWVPGSVPGAWGTSVNRKVRHPSLMADAAVGEAASQQAVDQVGESGTGSRAKCCGWRESSAGRGKANH